MRTLTATCLGTCLALMSARPAQAFNQPPANLGLTTFLDGGGAPPGVYVLQYVQHALGEQAVDKDGRVIPGGARVSALASLTQLWYLAPVKIFGAYLGLDAGVTLVAVTAKGSLGPAPVTANTAGMGDSFFGPALQWNDHKLLGRPFFHRFEVDAVLPTGSYDPNYSANPGSNILTVEPYYSFTWLFTEKWETSWRLFYDFHGENDKTRVKPGQLFHLNYAFSRSVHPKLRLGASGYFLQQTTDDQTNGVPMSGTRERAFALGPAIAYTTPSVLLMLSHPIEFGVENRFRGFRTTLQLILKL